MRAREETLMTVLVEVNEEGMVTISDDFPWSPEGNVRVVFCKAVTALQEVGAGHGGPEKLAVYLGQQGDVRYDEAAPERLHLAHLLKRWLAGE